MKTFGKVMLAGCTILVLLLVAGIVASVWYFRAHKDEFVSSAKRVRAEGIAAGGQLTEAQCVDKALSRYLGERGIVGGVRSRVWLSGCLTTSRPTENFCAGVPPDGEITQSAMWRVAQCQARGFTGDSTCPNILAAVQEHCAPGKASGGRP